MMTKYKLHHFQQITEGGNVMDAACFSLDSESEACVGCGVGGIGEGKYNLTPGLLVNVLTTPRWW